MTGGGDRVQIKRDLYQYVLNQVNLRSGSPQSEINNYKKTYDHLNHRAWKLSNRDELFRVIRKSKLIFMGDFHSLHQSQRSHMRILKNIQLKTFRIAVECIAYQHQKYLDQYLNNEIDENSFLKKVAWKKLWGFPWEHYREIFHWAKQNRISIIALNDLKHRNLKDSLRKRDSIANHILSERRKKSASPIFVIYGESHLASKTLMNDLDKQKVKYIKIFQNIDEIYFELMDLNKEDDVDVIKFNKNEYCIMNVPPWVKWQSHLMYLENKYDHEIENETLDFTDYIDQYIKLIAQELKINVNTKNLSVYSSFDFSFLKRFQQNTTRDEYSFYKLLIEEERTFYIPRLGFGYLGRSTINQASSLAMQYVYFELNKIKDVKFSLPEHFLSLIWLEAISYFGTKLINPKRKTETIADIKKKILDSDTKEIQKEPLKLALFQKAKEIMVLSGRPVLRNKMEVKRNSSYIRCANLLGSLLGEKIYKGYKRQAISLEFVLSLISKKIGTQPFDMFYYEMLEVIENLPETFKSKIDRL
ncbi:MAG: ChaN family lipoprotein [Bdellovibrionaceae bacterium]|nr:ChaN family lipoprotein [Pseudobdellovibrionaceae bacterium]